MTHISDDSYFVCPWDGWEFVRLLGKGTYGQVFLVKKNTFGILDFAAIKHIRVPGDERLEDELISEGLITDEATMKTFYSQMVESYLSEININMMLRGHSNFVSYNDHKILMRPDARGYDIYIRMEYLTTLRERMRSAPIKMEDILNMGVDICMALSLLQKKRLIHRDVKPENIFLSPDGRYKLGDFGVSKFVSETPSRLTARGTLLFMAPELARQEMADHRIDIYSLGMVLYRLLNGGRAPFLPPLPTPLTHEEYQKAQKMRLDGVKIPNPVFADTTLSDIITRACAYQPNDRWPSASQMRKCLNDYRFSCSRDTLEATMLDLTDSGLKLASSISIPSLRGNALQAPLNHVCLSESSQKSLVASESPEGPAPVKPGRDWRVIRQIRYPETSHYVTKGPFPGSPTRIACSPPPSRWDAEYESEFTQTLRDTLPHAPLPLSHRTLYPKDVPHDTAFSLPHQAIHLDKIRRSRYRRNAKQPFHIEIPKRQSTKEQ